MIKRIIICSEKEDVIEAMMNVAKNKKLTFEARVSSCYGRERKSV